MIFFFHDFMSYTTHIWSFDTNYDTFDVDLSDDSMIFLLATTRVFLLDERRTLIISATTIYASLLYLYTQSTSMYQKPSTKCILPRFDRA
jgi:hypothetical protein